MQGRAWAAHPAWHRPLRAGMWAPGLGDPRLGLRPLLLSGCMFCRDRDPTWGRTPSPSQGPTHRCPQPSPADFTLTLHSGHGPAQPCFSPGPSPVIHSSVPQTGPVPGTGEPATTTHTSPSPPGACNPLGTQRVTEQSGVCWVGTALCRAARHRWGPGVPWAGAATVASGPRTAVTGR